MMMKNQFLKILIASLLFFYCNCNQAQTITIFNDVKITYLYKPKETDFLVTTRLNGRVSTENAWLGIGLNSNAAMVIEIKSILFYKPVIV